jgi:hypothetical protein
MGPQNTDAELVSRLLERLFQRSFISFAMCNTFVIPTLAIWSSVSPFSFLELTLAPFLTRNLIESSYHQNCALARICRAVGPSKRFCDLRIHTTARALTLAPQLCARTSSISRLGISLAHAVCSGRVKPLGT